MGSFSALPVFWRCPSCLREVKQFVAEEISRIQAETNLGFFGEAPGSGLALHFTRLARPRRPRRPWRPWRPRPARSPPSSVVAKLKLRNAQCQEEAQAEEEAKGGGGGR